MDYKKEIEETRKMREKWEDILHNKTSTEDYMEEKNLNYFQVILIAKKNIKNATKRGYVLIELEKLRRSEQSFLSKHTGKIVPECNREENYKIYNYGFGSIAYRYNKICVKMNNKIYEFKDKKDIEFVFTLFKKRKELFAEFYEINIVEDLR